MSQTPPRQPDRTPSRRGSAWLAGAITALAIALACAGLIKLRRETPLPEGLTPDEYRRAETRIRDTLRRDAGRIAVLSYLGEQAYAAGRYEKAIACFREVPASDADFGIASKMSEAEAQLKLDRAVDAERSYREVLACASESAKPTESKLVAGRSLAYILSVELRFEERKPILQELHASGRANVNDSKQLHFPTLLLSRSAFGREKLLGFVKRNPSDPHLVIARGRYESGEGDLDAARRTLETLHKTHPTDLDCAAALLECYFEADDGNRLVALIRSLPEPTPDEPWLLSQMRGHYWLEHDSPHKAIEAFQLVLDEDPANPACQMGVARAYGKLGLAAERERALQVSLVLSRIRVSLPKVTEFSPEAVRELAAECDRADLNAAAATFRTHAERIEAAAGHSSAEAVELRSKL